MKLICAMLLLLTTVKALAQYPFERFPVIKSVKTRIQVFSHGWSSTTAIYKSYKVKLLVADKYSDNTLLYFYHKNKLLITVPLSISYPLIGIDDFDAFYIEDINNDGFPDIKIVTANDASGLAGSYVNKVYLINHKNKRFSKIIYTDFANFPEIDIDGDNRFEIIGQEYLSYRNHAYWVFDLYNVLNGKLVNVSIQNNYPIATRFWGGKDDYAITHNITRKNLLKYSKRYPNSFYW